MSLYRFPLKTVNECSETYSIVYHQLLFDQIYHFNTTNEATSVPWFQAQFIPMYDPNHQNAFFVAVITSGVGLVILGKSQEEESENLTVYTNCSSGNKDVKL